MGITASPKPWAVILLLAILRIVRAWNQAGQKHAGQADIARTILPQHNVLLWFSVLATYLDVVQRLSRGSIPWASRQLSSAASLALGIAALGFKVAVTKADAPELLDGLDHSILDIIEKASLVSQARAVFTSIIVMMIVTGLPRLYRRLYQKRIAQGIY